MIRSPEYQIIDTLFKCDPGLRNKSSELGLLPAWAFGHSRCRHLLAIFILRLSNAGTELHIQRPEFVPFLFLLQEFLTELFSTLFRLGVRVEIWEEEAKDGSRQDVHVPRPVVVIKIKVRMGRRLGARIELTGWNDEERFVHLFQ